MYIELEKEFYEEKVRLHFSEDSNVVQQAKDGLRFKSSSFDLNVTSLEWEDLEKLYNIAKDAGDRSLMIHIASIRNLLTDLNGSKIGSLRALAAGLIAYFSTDAIDGWLYHMDENRISNPWLVKRIQYHKGGRGEDEKKQSVTMELIANTPKTSSGTGFSTRTLTFDSDDIHGTSIPQLLSKSGFYHESRIHRTLYNDHIALFEKYQPEINKQFWVRNQAFEGFDYRHDQFSIGRSKAVNDEDTIARKFTPSADPSFWRKLDVAEKFDEVPFHCYVYLFHLDLHKNIWVHVSNMEPYVYSPELKDKLILPQEHRDLIDILVEDMDILQEDIIQGKSGGTTILCTGKPGLGKTLSAEVYSEVIERPLYKVHSGQLGLNASGVERSLETILKRAARWGAVLLIDEADVYIRVRGNDLDQNAVVAAFLRTLEYFSGLLFMTTNRGDDVDDAILSRCIAVIKYETPSADNAKRIWRVLSDQFGVEISSNLISELVEKFPTASGRDIKELLKLTSRYAKGKNLPYSYETFRQCAQFRGIV